ncbi:MAG: SDR family oxidoreductase, partial [Dehalococcoidia bacterium]|nr:SDR family oxidoreductase [Dehalococcoidia bacterium]
LPAADVERVWRVNVLGVILAVQAALAALRDRKGLIVNISSETSVNANPGLAGYASTKAALNQLTNTLRKELEPDGVRVLNIFPGFLKNEFGENAIYAEEDIDMARLVRHAPTSRTSDDAARDIVAAIQQDLDDWRYTPPPRR